MLNKENEKFNKTQAYDECMQNIYRNIFSGVDDEISFLVMIGTKVIFCDEKNKNHIIDIDRLYDELVYMKYYSKMSNTYLMGFFIPIMLVNRSFEGYGNFLIDLAGKITKFYKSEKDRFTYVLDMLILDNFFRKSVIKKIKKDELLEYIKEVKDIIVEYNPIFKRKVDSVNFQIEKIKYIDKVYKIIKVLEISEHNESLNGDNIDSESMCYTGNLIIDLLYFYVTELYSIEKFDYSIYGYNNISGIVCIENIFKTIVCVEKRLDNTNERFSRLSSSLANYLCKLRYFEINTNKYNEKSTPRRFLDMEIGDKFVDPILNNSIIISKKISDNSCLVSLDTKTGRYDFKFEIKVRS